MTTTNNETHTKRYMLHATRSSNQHADTHTEVIHPRSRFQPKSSRSKDSKSKMQLSNFCCRWDIASISIMDVFPLDRERIGETVIMQNKPNLNISIFTLTSFLIKGYVKLDTWYCGKNKPNTNPIQSQTKPIQTQYKPNTNPFRTLSKPNFKTTFNGCSVCWIELRYDGWHGNSNGSCKYLPIHDNLDFYNSSFYGRSDMSGKLNDMMTSCNLCPRRCGVDRLGGEVGYCGIGADPRVSSYGPHFGEEAELVGTGGSGTIFFAGCNLRCIFCQNHDISQEYTGQDISIDKLVDIIMFLEEQRTENINFVSPSHVAAHVAEAIERARSKGLAIPTVYNTGGYDSIETLKELEGLIDIYMPDMKYSNPDLAKKLSDADDYPEVNRSAVREMHRQVGDLSVEGGVAVKGLLVRHLVLPNHLAGSFKIMDFLADEISVNTAINVMAQYRPCWHASLCKEVNRYPKAEEITEATSYAKKKGMRVLP